MRIAWITLAVVLCAAAARGQEARRADPPDGRQAPDRPAEEAPSDPHEKLAMIVDEVDFEDIQLREVFAFVRDASGLNLQVNWPALRIAGIERTEPVTVKLRDVSVERVLRATLRAAGGVTPLDFAVDEGVVVVSTRDELSMRTVLRIYPVADLVCRTRLAFNETPAVPWRHTVFLPRKIGPVISDNAQEGGLFGIEHGFEQTEFGIEEATAALVDTLEETIDPASWRPAGEIGMIRVQGTNLVIRQTHANHEAIAELLDMFRASRAESRTRVGLAIVRIRVDEARERLEQIVRDGGDVGEAIRRGERDELWMVERCGVEETHVGDVILARKAYHREVSEAVVGEQTALMLTHETFAGYEVGVVARSRRDEGLELSAAVGSGWLEQGQDPREDKPQANQGVHSRHDVREFTLAPGRAEAVPVIPEWGWRHGVAAIVWLPGKE